MRQMLILLILSANKFLPFTLLRNFKELFIFRSPTVCLIEMGFGSKCGFLNEQVFYIKEIKIEHFLCVTHYP